MNISSLISSAKFKPLIIPPRVDRKHEGGSLTDPGNKPVAAWDEICFGALMHQIKDNRRQT